MPVPRKASCALPLSTPDVCRNAHTPPPCMHLKVPLVTLASAVVGLLEAHASQEPVVEVGLGCLRNLSIAAPNLPALRELGVGDLARDAMARYPASEALQQWGRAVRSRL
jgi:hypothetical protein